MKINNDTVKNIILGTVATIIFVAVGFAALMYATSPEVWYAGMHDSKCEKMLHGEKCNCYERLIEADKAEMEAKKNK